MSKIALLTVPSFWSLVFTGMAILYIIIELLFRKLIKNGGSKTSHLVMVILIGLLVGVHGLLHLGMESVYGYNPMMILTGSNNIEL